MAKPILVRIVGDADFSKATKAAGGFGKSIGNVLKGVGIGAGLALADSLAGSFGEALDIGAGTDKLAAQLGVTGAEAEKFGKIAGDLYANAYGESFEDVASVVRDAVTLNIPEAELSAITGQAFSMASAFEGAAGEYLQLANQFTEQGVTGSVQESLDLITTSFQQLPGNMQGPLTDAVNEYSVFLDGLGFSTEEIFGGLTEAASRGEFELDKFGDAIKEFGIRATDGSKATSTAFADIGISVPEDIDHVVDSLLNGGDAAQAATQRIVEGLLSIEDPGTQAANAVALFGTPIEDLGVQNIPRFLESLQDMGAGFETVEGAAATLDAEINDNLRTKLETFRRQGLQALARFTNAVVVPAIEGLADVFGKTLGPAIDFVRDQASRIGDIFRTAFAFFQGNEDVVGAFFENQATSLGRFVGSVARVASEVVGLVGDIAGTITSLFSGSGEGTVGGIKDTINGLLDSVRPLVVAIGDFFAVLRTGEGYEDFNQNARTAALAVREFAGILINDVVPAVREFASRLVAGVSEVADVLINEWLPVVLEFAGKTVELFQELWPQIQPVLGQLVDLVGSVFGLVVEIVKATVAVVTAVWDRWGDEIFNVAKVIFEAIIGVVRGALDIVTGIIKVATAVLQGDWSAAWDGVKQILSGAWEIIKSVIILGWEAVKLIFRAAIGIVKILFNELWDGLKASLSAAWGVLKSIVTVGWADVANIFRAYVGVLKTVWGGLWAALKALVSAGLGVINGAVSRGLSAMAGAFRRLPGTIRSAVAGLFDPIYNQFKKVIDRVRSLWSKLDFKIPEIKVPGLGSVGGGSISGLVNSLPFFANGNVATGPTLGVFGEYPGARSNPEITTPESLMASVFRNVLREQGSAQRGGNRQLAENIQIYTQPGRDLAAELDLALKMEFG